ncbi:protein MICROTUBULE BINDING PROTEIN 2C isoform X2 [Macadamia integrifolia]|uniref:protein MICROTUBULE BINDING PROTEIN 2C isoform X2 n=1 Tax=Macadamia integrifolia TaxID=60698 RepID=UPI001C500C10|nr:protein MICROTUBULE BINDING PROTEIN 2C isoform X2 [Macadamia integrifolia]
MFEQQHFVDLQEDESFGDPKSWLSGEDQSSPLPQRTMSSLSNGNVNNGNVDRVLYKNLVEMVPLIESLMDRRANTSFTRRSSLVYTKTPSREPFSKKESKGRKAAQSIPIRKQRDIEDKDPSKNTSPDDFSLFSSKTLALEKDREDLIVLQKQVEDLQKKLLEKDELLKAEVSSKNLMIEAHAKIEEQRRLIAEKDSLVKSAHSQLSDAKIKLADKQAALEKLRWEAMTSNQKVEKIQEELDSMQGEISSFMLLFEGLTTNDSSAYAEDYDINPYHLDPLPPIDQMDDMEMQKMEEAREAYIAAVHAAKENQDEESLAAAAEARFRLQSFVFKTNNQNADISRDRPSFLSS